MAIAWGEQTIEGKEEGQVGHSAAGVVICGAGIAGIALAHHLAVREGVRDVLLVEPRPPLSLTSDKSTECYRNWWPGPDDAMVAFMNRSIDLLETLARESGNRFRLNRRGYVYATAEPAQGARFEREAQRAAEQGAGPLRRHAGAGGPAYQPASPHDWEREPTGADLLLDPALIRTHFPYLSPQTVAVLHARRCGWLSAQQLGMLLLEEARAQGVRLLRAEVRGVEQAGGRVTGVRVAAEDGERTIATPCFVNAAGPFVGEVGRMLGVELPVYSELHIKVALSDHRALLPRDAPMLIWSDPTRLPWSEEERDFLAETEALRPLLGTLPAGAHTRPDGGSRSDILLLLWSYDAHRMEPRFPLPLDEHHPEIILRGVATMIPALARYLDPMPRPMVDGGYYTRTPENRPLITPLPVAGAYLIGALSGFGVMAAPAAAELLAAYLTQGAPPAYAPAFHLDRYDDPAYLSRMLAYEDGQL